MTAAMLTEQEAWAVLGEALDALPTRELVAGDYLVDTGEGPCFCAVGAVARMRLGPSASEYDLRVTAIQIHRYELAGLRIPEHNDWVDEDGDETPSARWHRMRALARVRSEESRG